jgi:hypothetical protein
MRRNPCPWQVFVSMETAINFIRFMALQSVKQDFVVVSHCSRCKKIHVKG